MKFISFQLLAATLVPLTNAFPAAVFEAAAADPALQARADEIAKILAERQTGAGAATGIFEPIPKFDASKQKINVGPGSGNEYRAPGSGDLRGPCPGLNAFANHGK